MVPFELLKTFSFFTENTKDFPVAGKNINIPFSGTPPAQTPEQPEQPEPPQTGDFAILAMATLLAMSGAAFVLLKKKEF